MPCPPSNGGVDNSVGGIMRILFFTAFAAFAMPIHCIRIILFYPRKYVPLKKPENAPYEARSSLRLFCVCVIFHLKFPRRILRSVVRAERMSAMDDCGRIEELGITQIEPSHVPPDCVHEVAGSVVLPVAEVTQALPSQY